MRELFDLLIEEGEPGIDRLIEERMQEGVQLDFKTKTNRVNGRFDDADKKVLGKVLSAFSNSAGGLVVWGVNAEKVDGVDCAQAPALPIAEIERFQSEATTLVGQLIQPKHDGIKLSVIPSAREPGSGYLLMFVERSERRPHRSEAKGEKQYFKRSGDSSFAMEHYDIEDAFRRVSVPTLELTYTIDQCSVERDDLFFRIAFALTNNSTTSARGAYIAILTSEVDYDYRMSQQYKVDISGDGKRIYFTDNTSFINPDVTKLIAAIAYKIPRVQGYAGFAFMKGNMKADFTVWFGCQDARMTKTRVVLTPDVLISHVPKEFHLIE